MSDPNPYQPPETSLFRRPPRSGSNAGKVSAIIGWVTLLAHGVLVLLTVFVEPESFWFNAIPVLATNVVGLVFGLVAAARQAGQLGEAALGLVLNVLPLAGYALFMTL